MNRIDLAGRFLHFLQHRLEALLEFAAVLRAGDQRAHVQRHDALVLQALGHVAAHDAQRQSLHDGGLAHAGLADQHGVILGAPREHLDHAADLLVAADHRVELALRGQPGQVAPVAFQGLVGGFGILRGHALAAAHLAQGLHQALVGEAEFLQQFARGAALVDSRQQDVLHRNVLVLQLARLVFGGGQQTYSDVR